MKDIKYPPVAIIKDIDVPFILIERTFSVPFYALLNSKTVIFELGHSWIKWAIYILRIFCSNVSIFADFGYDWYFMNLINFNIDFM